FAEDARIALYYAPPPESAWWRAGCEWLGRDPENGRVFSACEMPGLDLRALTRAPRRYGWHGTLVAPFRLAPGVTPHDVLRIAREWARHIACFDLDMKPACMGRFGFVALRAATAMADDALRAIAAGALAALAPCARSIRTTTSSGESPRA